MIREKDSTPTPHPRAAFSAPRRLTGRTGFSLVEVIVAIALFGISMSAIAALTFAVTRRAKATAASVERTAVLEARANDLFSIPWANIDGRVGCTTITTNPVPRTECISVVTTTATRKMVTLVVTPTDATIPAASIKVERTMPPAANPFNTNP